jgi:uncharacterized protein (DUF779 family)
MTTSYFINPAVAAMAARQCATRRASFRAGDQDVRLGKIDGCPFYIGAAQFEYRQHTQLIIDVVPGRGSGFSLEAPLGVRFLTRSCVFTDEEAAYLESAGPPARGATR